MKKNTKILFFVLIMFSFSLAFMILTGLFSNYKNKVSYVFLGDSILGNVRDESSIPALVSNSQNVSFINGGLGGTTASKIGNSFSNKAEFSASLANISEAICSNDFSYVLASQPVRFDGDLTYFQDAVKDLSHVDFEKADVIIIEHGLNDYFTGIPVYNKDNMLDESSYYGAVVSSVLRLKEKCESARIILVTPVSVEVDATEYADAMIEAAANTGVEVLDMCRLGVVTKENEKESTIDGIHLSESARRKYAEILVDYINGNE